MGSTWLAAVAAIVLGLLGTSQALRVSDFPCKYYTFPQSTPNTGWPDGPILGNGNIGLSVGGASNLITLYLTVNGFWGVGYGTNSSMPPLTGRAAAPGFPGCPNANCSIPVGLLIGGINIYAPTAGGSWTSTLFLDNATAVVEMSNATTGAALRLTAWVSATEQIVSLALVNTGSVPLPALNISSWANGNVLNVSVTSNCVSPSSGLPAACAPGTGVPLPGAGVRKAASLPGSPLPIDGVVAFIPVSPGAVTAASSSETTFTVPYKFWANNSAVATETHAVSVFVQLLPGAALQLVASAAGSRDPGVFPGDVTSAVAARLVAAAQPGALDALAAAHTAWWNAFWAASSIELDAAEAATEGFWYSAVYAMGAGSRPGQIAADLWGPWRTTDYSKWRSNPTMDYNEQALFSGVFASNHVELAEPYYDFLDQASCSAGIGARQGGGACCSPLTPRAGPRHRQPSGRECCPRLPWRHPPERRPGTLW